MENNNFIRKIIIEELSKALREASINKHGELVDFKIPSMEDQIIYSYTKGRDFAINKLQADINGLNDYVFVEYLPKNEEDESWSFEYSTMYNTIIIVDIQHKLISDKSYWNLILSELQKGSQLPEVIKSSGPIDGYKNFINNINQKISKTIDSLSS